MANMRIRQLHWRRAGMTMIELLIAASATALTATAGAGLLFAISSASTQTRDYRVERQAGHYALGRIGRIIRESRNIGYVSSHKVALWLNDANENEQVDLQEVGQIEYDSSNKLIRFRHFDTGGAAAPVNVVGLTLFSDEAAMNTALSSGGAKSQTFAQGVDSLSFVGYPDGVEARLVMTEFVMTVSDIPQVFHLAAGPRAPAEYLLVPNTRHSGTTETPMSRRKFIAVWNGVTSVLSK